MQMAEFLDQDPSRGLGLEWRIRLWSRMQRVYGDEAQFRRDALAYLVASDLLAMWHSGGLTRHCPNRYREAAGYPNRAMDIGRLFLQRPSSRDEITGVFGDMAGVMDYISPYYASEGSACAYTGIWALGLRLLRDDDKTYSDFRWYERVWIDDEHLNVDDRDLLQLLYCETHYWAAEAVVHNSPRGEVVATPSRFWREWLQRTVPKVLGPIAEVRELVQ